MFVSLFELSRSLCSRSSLCRCLSWCLCSCSRRCLGSGSSFVLMFV